MNEASKMAYKVVSAYIDELEKPVSVKDYWHSSYFAQRSYAKTAAYEILGLLRNSSEPPLVVIEEYRDKMNEYACLNSFTSVMFSVASRTADNIVDALIGSCY